ncbi:MAG: RNA 2'-phosphotransferase [Petrimonas sp.]|nr:RNA 2'-phosphotransferase [Petrimonas sp.]
MDNQRNIKLSKFLCLILRHKPDIVGIELDNRGWADVSNLLEGLYNAGKSISIERLKQIVETDNKNRFSFNETGDKIRANQGHSIKIDLGYNPEQPPEILYHGTAKRFVESILANGLEKKKRHHVHLSPDVGTAIKVGQRHGEPVVFTVLSGQMFNDGILFYLTENGVWLTEKVPIEYISILNL